MPIKMTPEEYYEAFTKGNYNDFLENPSSVMKAFNSAVAASHLADCYYNYNKINNSELVSKYESLTDFIKFINQDTNNFFKDIRSISNAYKHLYTGLNHNFADYSSISSAGTIESIVFEGEEINQISEELLDENTYDPIVVYTRKTGEQIQFIKAIEVVIDFWEIMINNIKSSENEPCCREIISRGNR